MKEQEKIEQTLREIHVLLSKCEYFNNNSNLVIVDKKELFRLLEKISMCMYEMMDEYEVTEQSRARGNRRAKEQGEAIVQDAVKKADDVYAAAMIYTDDALARLRERFNMAMEDMEEVFSNIRQEMAREDGMIADNQRELREQLEEMHEGEKYIKIMDEENKKRDDEATVKEDIAGGEEKKPLYKSMPRPDKYKRDEPIKIVAPTPEIKINPAYEENLVMDSFKEGPVTTGGPQISVNLDAEYFKWKNGGELPDVEEGIVDDEGEIVDKVETAEPQKKSGKKIKGSLFGKK